AVAYAEAGLWDVTSRHLAKVFQRHSPNFTAETWRLYACLRLLEGDKKGYRRQCERMIERFGQSSCPHDWHCLATACVLAPEHTGDVTRWVQLQEKFADADRKPWNSFYVGLAYYRAGRHDQSLKPLQAMSEWHMSWPVLAMAYQRLGNANEARKWLAKADDTLEKALRDQRTEPRLKDPLTFSGWTFDRPQFWLLYREAKALIAGPAAEAPWQRLIANRPAFKPGRSGEADLAANLHAIGVLQGELGQIEAEKSLAEALALREALVKKHPHDAEIKADLAATQMALGNLDWKAGRYAEGARRYEKGLSLLDVALREEPQNKQLLTLSAHHERTFAEHYAEVGAWAEAANHSAKAFERQPSEN